MQLKKMPVIEGRFNPIIHSRREMDGYAVENIAIESHKIPIALLLQTYNSKRVLDYLLSRDDVDPGHPLPGDALKGNEAVMKSLGIHREI